MMIMINVNGRMHRIDADPQKPLLWVLREDIGLNGTKYSCGIGICGCCAVLVDGSAIHSCMVTIGAVADCKIITIEGLNSDVGTAVKEAWIAEQVPQCGYCQPAQIIKATYLLSQNPDPSEADIDKTMTSLCRCGTYPRIRAGIKSAAAILKEKKDFLVGRRRIDNLQTIFYFQSVSWTLHDHERRRSLSPDVVLL